MSSTVERTRFGWARWIETPQGIERTYTVCEPGTPEWKRDLIQAKLFADDRVGLSQVVSRWLVRGTVAALAVATLVAFMLDSIAVVIPIALSMVVAAVVLVKTLPNFGEQLVEKHTITVEGESCRLVTQIAAVLDRIEPAPSDVDRDDQLTMWRLAHTDPEFLASYSRTVREWEVSHHRLRSSMERSSLPEDEPDRVDAAWAGAGEESTSKAA